MTSEPTCAQRIAEHHEGRKKDYLRYLNAMNSEASDDFKGRAEENTEPLGMSIGIVVRIDMSTGGPGDWYELTFDNEGNSTGGDYHFNDWFDHAQEPMDDDELDAVLARFALDDPYMVLEAAQVR